MTASLLWHEYCTLLVQLRWQRDNVVRFLHLFKFGLVVFTEFVSGRRAAVVRLPLVLFYFCKNYDASVAARMTCLVYCMAQMLRIHCVCFVTKHLI